jgi:hypothetical protein
VHVVDEVDEVDDRRLMINVLSRLILSKVKYLAVSRFPPLVLARRDVLGSRTPCHRHPAGAPRTSCSTPPTPGAPEGAVRIGAVPVDPVRSLEVETVTPLNAMSAPLGVPSRKPLDRERNSVVLQCSIAPGDTLRIRRVDPAAFPSKVSLIAVLDAQGPGVDGEWRELHTGASLESGVFFEVRGCTAPRM